MRVILPILVFICVGCTSNKRDINIAEHFVKSVILDDNFNVSLLGDYIAAKNTPFENKQVQEVLAGCIAFIKDDVLENEGIYEIVPHSTKMHQEIIKDYDLNYDDTEQIFYVVTDKKVITHIIVKDHKVISFYTSITKKNRNRFPWIL